MNKLRQREICERLGLNDGQFFAEYYFKNLQWFLNDEKFGYGDLTVEQILHIADTLDEDETFEGYNEHHGTNWQQRSNPMVIITHQNYEFPTHRR